MFVKPFLCIQAILIALQPICLIIFQAFGNEREPIRVPHSATALKLAKQGINERETKNSVMAKNCCWNCKYYVARGDNEPPVLSGATSNVCVFSENEQDVEDPVERDRNWEKKASPTPPNYVCRYYKERFY